MKKQKQFSKRGFFYDDGNSSWSVSFFDDGFHVGFFDHGIYFPSDCKKRFKKFVNALRKGLKRLDK